jgi:2-methylcitrate dehydratase PrpD
MIVLCRRASHHEFEDASVAGAAMQDLQVRTSIINDPKIDALGYDLIRSRIEVDAKDGRTLVQWADERYRGGPLNPISDADLDGKFRMCAEGVVDGALQDELLALARGLDQGADLARLMAIVAGGGSDADAARIAAQ